MMLDAGSGDDRQKVDRPENRRVLDDGCGDKEDIARQHTHDRRRRVAADCQPFGDEQPVRHGDLRQKMRCEFFIAIEFVAIVDRVEHEQLRRGAQQRRVASLVVGAGEIDESVGRLLRWHQAIQRQRSWRQRGNTPGIVVRTR